MILPNGLLVGKFGGRSDLPKPLNTSSPSIRNATGSFGSEVSITNDTGCKPTLYLSGGGFGIGGSLMLFLSSGVNCVYGFIEMRNPEGCAHGLSVSKYTRSSESPISQSVTKPT